jgi:hypothetical protein
MRLRWRVRTSMIAVAAVACILGVSVSVRHRAERFRLLAAYHREQYDELRSAIPFPGEEAYYAATSSEFQQLCRRPKRVVVQTPPLCEWHMQMSRKYTYAAAHPWLPVSGDPPPP